MKRVQLPRRMSQQQATIRFPKGHNLHGVEATVRVHRDMELLAMFALMPMDKGSKATPADKAKIVALFRAWGDRALVSWNVEDSDGAPVPPTADGVTSLPLEAVMALVEAWAKRTIGYGDSGLDYSRVKVFRA